MKLPSFQFYPGDWRKDPGVQALSYHDRGVWFEILCLMHESDERGKLLLNGNPMPDDALARLLGLDKQTLTTTLTSLLTYGVASREEGSGALICRRMIRDEEIRKIRTESGKKGGNPRLLNQTPNQKPTTPDKQKSTPSSSSSTSVKKREEAAPALPPPEQGKDEIAKTVETDLALFGTLQTPEFREAWTHWLEHHAEKKRGDCTHLYLPNVRRFHLETLARQGVERAVAIVKFSRSKGAKNILFEASPEQLGTYLPSGAATDKPKRELTPEEQREVLLSRRKKAGKQ